MWWWWKWRGEKKGQRRDEGVKANAPKVHCSCSSDAANIVFYYSGEKIECCLCSVVMANHRELPLGRWCIHFMHIIMQLKIVPYYALSS